MFCLLQFLFKSLTHDINYILQKGKDPSMAELYPAALGIYGHWLAESRSENPGIIIEDYMEHVNIDSLLLSKPILFCYQHRFYLVHTYLMSIVPITSTLSVDITC